MSPALRPARQPLVLLGTGTGGAPALSPQGCPSWATTGRRAWQPPVTRSQDGTYSVTMLGGVTLAPLWWHSQVLPTGLSESQASQGQADPLSRWKYLRRVLDMWGALARDSGCLLPPHRARHRALGRICPAPLAGETTPPVAREGLAKTSRPSQDPQGGARPALPPSVPVAAPARQLP